MPLSSGTSVLTSIPVEVVAAFVLALVALAVDLTPLPYPRLAKWASLLCLVAAAELVLARFLPARWFFLAAVPVGGAMLALFAVRLWRVGGRPLAGSTDDPPPAFETTEGGTTHVEGGSVEGYSRVSRATDAIASFIDVKIRRR